mgnify:CR=1 FL=1
MRRLITAIFWILPVSGLTQYSALGSWNILNLKYSYNEKTSIFGEAQLRSLAFYNQFHYYEYKGGIYYKVYKNVELTIGAGSYQTYKEGGNFVESLKYFYCSEDCLGL